MRHEVSADEKVLADAEVDEDLATLGHVADAGGDDAIGAPAREILAAKDHTAAVRPHEPGDRAQRGRLAAAVGAQQGDDLAVGDAERNAVERTALAVRDAERFQLEHQSSVPPR